MKYIVFLLMFYVGSAYAVDCGYTFDAFLFNPVYALTDPCNPPDYSACGMEPFYVTDGVTFSEMFNDKVIDIKESYLITFLNSFFQIELLSSCEPWVFSIPFIETNVVFDWMCSSEVNTAVGYLGYVLIVFACFYAVRVMFF